MIIPLPGVTIGTNGGDNDPIGRSDGGDKRSDVDGDDDRIPVDDDDDDDGDDVNGGELPLLPLPCFGDCVAAANDGTAGNTRGDRRGGDAGTPNNGDVPTDRLLYSDDDVDDEVVVDADEAVDDSNVDR
jgi:hypothetical protein